MYTDLNAVLAASNMYSISNYMLPFHSFKPIFMFCDILVL